MSESEILPISAVEFDPQNARKRTERSAAMIKESLQQFGPLRSLVGQKLPDGRIIVRAGNGTLEEAGKIGVDKVRIVERRPDELIVVVADDLDENQWKSYAIADNRTSDLSEWDEGILEELAQDVSLDDWFTAEEMEGWDVDFADIESLDPVEPLTDEDAVPEDVETRCKKGDIWQLGRHRLMCGDSTVISDVERLMDGKKADMVFTDPPYGVNYEGGHLNKRKREKLAGDDTTAIYTEIVPILAIFCDGPIYTWYAGTKPVDLYNAVAAVGEIHALIIWHKVNATYAAMNAQYKQRHEPCLYWKPKGKTLRWVGPTNERTVWEIKRDPSNNFHPTQKPVELAERAINNHDAPKVLDLFLGSGSTLIACEKTGRTCYGMELSEKYCDVILKRWEDYTGNTAVRVED